MAEAWSTFLRNMVIDCRCGVEMVVRTITRKKNGYRGRLSIFKYRNDSDSDSD